MAVGTDECPATLLAVKDVPTVAASLFFQQATIVDEWIVNGRYDASTEMYFDDETNVVFFPSFPWALNNMEPHSPGSVDGSAVTASFEDFKLYGDTLPDELENYMCMSCLSDPCPHTDAPGDEGDFSTGPD